MANSVRFEVRDLSGTPLAELCFDNVGEYRPCNAYDKRAQHLLWTIRKNRPTAFSAHYLDGSRELGSWSLHWKLRGIDK